jgi:D-serine deaminase-like pyridoxal phosphate-dependent protein
MVWNRPELTMSSASEEHLSLMLAEGFSPPRTGELLYLIPKHVCPTVNNFDQAILVSAGRIVDVFPVSARGREQPLLGTEIPNK